MSRYFIRVAVLCLVPLAAAAADYVLHPEHFESLTTDSFDYVAVRPSGNCFDGGVPGPVPAQPATDGGPAIPPTCWATEASWSVDSLSGELPPVRGLHESATNAATIPQVQSLIENVALPAADVQLAGLLALGLHERPTLQHVVWASLVFRASGARKASMAAYPGLEVLLRMQPLDPRDKPLFRIVSVPGPYMVSTVDADGGVTESPAPGTLPLAAVASAQVLVGGFVNPAVKEETGVR